MPLSFLINRFGYGIRVRPIGYDMALSFVVVELRYGRYYFIRYDDGRTGYVDIGNIKVFYEIDRGLTCTKVVRSVCNIPAEIPSESTPVETKPEGKSGWFGSLVSWIKNG